MATILSPGTARPARDRFTFGLVAAMAVVLVTGFSLSAALGRSSFGEPAVWHAHAFVFFGWVALVLTQTWLGTQGPVAVHRRLGWLAVAWLPLMAVMGTAVTVATIQRGTAPFFFLPQHFLVMNPLCLLGALGLAAYALKMRRRTDWHQRLQIVAFAGLVGPGFGRLLPMPFMIPVAFEVAALAGLLFPAYAMLRERRRTGHVHPAWWTGIAVIMGTMLVAEVIAYSPVGAVLYAQVTAGTPGAALGGLAYGKFPPGL